ncbi:MAG TPA: hypothetical protein VMF53_06655 [Alphaproteobacteria bacterium]|nr:hypothetical protein [Alphaproteobacteria bacterium]
MHHGDHDAGDVGVDAAVPPVVHDRGHELGERVGILEIECRLGLRPHGRTYVGDVGDRVVSEGGAQPATTVAGVTGITSPLR